MNIYPWQQQQWQDVIGQYQQQRLPHALLLNGPNGLGQFDFAKTLAATLLCEATATDQACEQCRSCHLIKTGCHPDLFIVTPEEKSTTIKVDQVRRLTEKLNTTAQQAGYQVAVLYPAEQMNRAAANALLKTLEEPPGDVVIMLVSQQDNLLPATIISRCQKIYFTGTGGQTTLEWLQARLASDNDAALLLRMAEYAPLHAVYLSENNYLELRNSVLKHLIAVQTQQADPIAPVADWLKQDTWLLLHATYTILADLIRLQLGVHDAYLTNQDCVTPLRQLVHKLPKIPVQAWLSQLQKAQQLESGSANVNIQLLLENLFIEWSHLQS